jgi:hypothetical protein
MSVKIVVESTGEQKWRRLHSKKFEAILATSPVRKSIEVFNGSNLPGRVRASVRIGGRSRDEAFYGDNGFTDYDDGARYQHVHVYASLDEILRHDPADVFDEVVGADTAAHRFAAEAFDIVSAVCDVEYANKTIGPSISGSAFGSNANHLVLFGSALDVNLKPVVEISIDFRRTMTFDSVQQAAQAIISLLQEGEIRNVS